ncbi:MAG: ABC transporter permease [Planctomycetes bacterium]|nr:ABC transporter permease [Planctomycetota bacterium]
MRILDLWPGIADYRRGRRARGVVLGALFLVLIAVAVWRHAVIGETLRTALARLVPGERPPLGVRDIDRIVSSLLVSGSIAAILASTAISAVRAGRRAPARRERESRWVLFGRQLLRNRLAATGLALLAALYLAAIICPLLTPYDPVSQGDMLAERLLPPSIAHPLGTDSFSRDVLSRILYGSRISLLVGLLAVGIAVSIGVIYGAVAGYCGGRVDGVMMRALDMLMAFPSIVIIITVMHLWRSYSIWLIIAVIGLLSWMGVARLVRGQFLVLKQKEFYQAAVALGAGPLRLIFLHLLPNASTPIIVSATLRVGNTILLEAGLSYLGLGVQSPTPSWGNIIYDNRNLIFSHWWIPFAAGLAIVLTVVAYNLLGDGLRDALDPRMQE